MTYNVSSGTLNLCTLTLTHLACHVIIDTHCCCVTLQ